MKLARDVRILLADDQTKVRSALRLLLEQEPGLEIAGEADSADRLVTRAIELQPDLVLLDWDLQATYHGSLLSTLRAYCPYLKVIVLSARPETRQPALAAGADAFVSKVDGPRAVLTALKTSLDPRTPTGSQELDDVSGH